MTDYPQTPLNRVKRNPKRATYDRATIHAILDAAMICHLAYQIDDKPYCTPTIHWREGEWLYWHGSSASRALRAQGTGLRVCLTVTHLDGIVLARAQFARQIDNGVAFRQGAAPFQFAQQIGSQTSRAGTDFEDVRRAERHHLLNLSGQCGTEGRRDFRCGDEIAGGAELARAPGVVAQPWRIQR